MSSTLKLTFWNKFLKNCPQKHEIENRTCTLFFELHIDSSGIIHKITKSVVKLLNSRLTQIFSDLTFNMPHKTSLNLFKWDTFVSIFSRYSVTTVRARQFSFRYHEWNYFNGGTKSVAKNASSDVTEREI